MKLENKKVLVTGASRGIGRAITEKFISEGAEVWGLASGGEPDDFAAAFSTEKLRWIKADLSKTNEIEALIENAVKESGGFDIVVNNAGITKDNLFFRMSLEEWQKVIDINLSAAFLVARIVGREMIRKRSGSIINMSSVVGVHGNGGQANYAASKAGLIGLTKSLAQEIGSRGIRVNAITPGFITTNMTASLPENLKDKMLERVPLRRFGTVQDIANVVLFLASDDSAYITGQVISVDGGMFM